jgi:thiol-disulfide isomerase/thioredoxin
MKPYIGILLIVAGCHRAEPKAHQPSKTDPTTADVTAAPAPTAVAGGTVDSEPNAPPIADVLAKAKAEDKPILLEFSTSWCHPCQEFKKNILPLPEVQAALSAYIFQVYDAEHGNGVAAATKYKVNGFPTFLVVDAEGEVHDRKGGLGTSGDFLRWAKAGQVMALSETQIQARLTKTPNDAQTVFAAARWNLAHDRNDAALELFERATKADADGKAGVLPDAVWEHDELVRQAAGQKAMSEDAARYLARFPHTERAFGALHRVLAGKPALAPAAAGKLIEQVAEGRKPEELNDFTYTALAVGAIDEALVLAQRMVKDSKDASLIDTLAEVYNFRGEKKLALETEDRALAFAAPGEKSALEANRKRYEAGAKTPSDVDTYKAMIARAGKPSSATKPKDDGPTNMPPAFAEMQAFSLALNGVTTDLANKCRDNAGGKDEVYVLFYLKADGGAPSKVVVVDPEAPPSVAGCVNKNVGEASLPKAPEAFHGRQIAKIRFAKSS